MRETRNAGTRVEKEGAEGAGIHAKGRRSRDTEKGSGWAEQLMQLRERLKKKEIFIA